MKNILKAVNVTISSYCIWYSVDQDQTQENVGSNVECKQDYRKFSDGCVVGKQCRLRSDRKMK